jgi:hypothetical protein
MNTTASRASERSQQPDGPLVEPPCVLIGRRSPEEVKKRSGVPGPRRGARIVERALFSNLPGQIPVCAEEAELVRIYFADLISTVLKDSQ